MSKMPPPQPRAVIYARYSTDLQNPNSIRDQIANCRARAAREGWTVVEEYSDAAQSGATNKRPGFQRLRRDLESNRFDIILTESLDRLSRDQADTAEFRRLSVFYRVPIHTLDHGEVSAMHVGFSGIAGELFLEALADKTRRGLNGRIADGKSAGGLSYGYRVARNENGVEMVGELAIVEEEAAIIRRIFREYADGLSPVRIAAGLNADRIPAPRSSKGTSGHWMQTTINGNRERGTGILNNELYVGRRIWNRLRYSRHPQTRKRVSRLNDRSEWKVAEVPHLRILDDALWSAVKARQDGLSKRRGALAPTKDRNGLSASQTLRRPRYLLSGLLECGHCGGNLTVAGVGKRRRYYCANHKTKGASICEGMPGLRQADAEQLVNRALQHELMTDAAYEAFRKKMSARLNTKAEDAQEEMRRIESDIRKLERAIENLLDTIENGNAPGRIHERLAEREKELADLTARRDALTPRPIDLPANLPDIYRRHVAALAATLSDEDVVHRATDEMRRMIERIVVRHDAEMGAHTLDVRGELSELLAAGNPGYAEGYRSSDRSLKLVAGVGFEPTTFRL